MLKNLFVLLLGLIITCQAGMLISSQSHIKVQNGYDILDDGDRIIVTADGGAFRFDKNGDNYMSPEFYGVEAGFPGVKVAGVCKDYRGYYWFVSPEGVVSIQNSDMEFVASFNDVVATNSLSLISITSTQKYIYLVTDKVLVRYVFNPSTNSYQVKDSNLNSGTIRSFNVFNGNLYLYSDKLRYISENAPNISDISLWSENNFPVSSTINRLKPLEDKFYALASDGLYEVELGNSTKKEILDGKSVLDAYAYPQVIGSIENIPFGFYYLLKVSNNQIQIAKGDFQDIEPQTMFYSSDMKTSKMMLFNDKIVCNAFNGYRVYQTGQSGYKEPDNNNPVFRNILSACTSGSKVVYSTNAVVSVGDYLSNSWSNAKAVLKRGSDHARLLDAGSNTVLGGYWGNGIQIFSLKKDQYNKDSISVKDSVMFQSAFQNGPYYPISYACAKDKNNDFWFAGFYVDFLDPTTTPSLVKLASLNQSGDMIEQNSLKFNMNSIGFKSPSCMTMDSKSRIWLGAKQGETGLAVISIGSNNAVSKSIVKTDYGIFSLLIDQNNILWLGTNIGAKYIDLNEISSVNDFKTDRIKSVNFVTSGQEVQNIYLTDNNEKWFATSGGVTILRNNDQDVYHLIQNYSKPDQQLSGGIEEIPMLNKGVINIIDLPLTKQKMFVFQDGFVVYDFTKGSVRNEISSSGTYPAPFLADGSSEVTFYIPDNGINYKYLKIFDLRGRLVKKIIANFSAGKVTWNGRDDESQIVSSGVYQYIVYSEENTQESIKGKMAIVRK